MSKKIFYIYNPKTLTYERVYPSLRQRIIVVLRHLFIGSILSIGVIVAFYFWFGSPKEELLKMENEQMQTQYKVLSKRVDAALEVLSDLQQRDDNMYRVILQAEPVNDEIRNNGIYNPSRYENLLQMSDAELVVSTSQSRQPCEASICTMQLHERTRQTGARPRGAHKTHSGHTTRF